MKKITIICPIYNEEKNIKIFVDTFLNIFEKYKEIEFSILFADNNSIDKSSEIIKSFCEKNDKIKYIKYSKNYGVMKTLYTAISQVNDDACSVFDCDLQDPPELIAENLNAILKSIGLSLSSFQLFNANDLPKWLGLLIFFLVSDFVQWNTHRLLHRVSFLWNFHKVHHSVKEMGFAAHLRYHWMEPVVYKSLLNQSFCASASIKFFLEASSISSTTSTPITPPFRLEKYENCSNSIPPPTPT